MRALTALLTLVTVLALLPTSTRALHRLNSPPPRPRGQSQLSAGGGEFARSTGRRLGVLAAVVAIGILIATATGPSVVVIALALGVIAMVAIGQWRRSVRQRTAAARRAAVIEACDVLAAELSAGRPPATALEGAATVCPDLEVASAAAKLGGDVPALLELIAESPGAEGLRALAAAWRVADESGAAFALITERLADSLRADETIRRQITASIAGTRATARLLAVLPAFGTALGYAIGADPLAFLTKTPPGWLCLALGLTLSTLGLHWTEAQTKPPWESRHSNQPT
ncbi:type II secretion system F family protein [Streptomyces sp. SID13031]|uniref:type II secretion system F family protein n=1 Tax=Streptomyces sp. SID13031 TaxID=2706046 RepID=UPI0013CD0D2F|nr:type II secretion system F family protein [Streptomyces sp. SID13031]NEA35618.1 type II secretion system protein [Streptomyces sp. SID13031]